jgi:hypothetical protein
LSTNRARLCARIRVFLDEIRDFTTMRPKYFVDNEQFFSVNPDFVVNKSPFLAPRGDGSRRRVETGSPNLPPPARGTAAISHHNQIAKDRPPARRACTAD